MTVKYLTQNRQLTFEIEAETHTAAFEKLAGIQEVFDGDHECGVCHTANPRFLHRTATKGTKVYDFYHLACRNHQCRARLDFGQAMEGGNLFPKRKDKDGNWIPNNGWTKYSAGTQGSASGSASQDSGDNDPWG